MRVAFPSNEYLDPNNIKSWSGAPFFSRQALESIGLEIVTLPLDEINRGRRMVRFLYWRWFHGKRYLRYYDRGLLESYGRQLGRQLATHAADVVLSLSTWPIAYLETNLPVVLWSDACFAGLLDFYDSFTNLAPPSIRAGHAAEQRALNRCARVIFPSQWAAQTTLAHYRVDPARIRIVPFGGNLPEPPTFEEAAAAVSSRDMSRCNLLFVGVDWKRKGADIAVETAEVLCEAGVDAKLTIVGCKPPPSRRLPSCVELVPFVSKDTVEEHRRCAEIFKHSHFFIMPSRAEAFGVVYAEASAFGVPCLAAKVGGVPSAVTDGVNGQLFPVEARGSEYAKYIMRGMQSPVRYRELALRTAKEGATRLSWKASGRKVAQILDETVQRKPAPSARAFSTAC
jgi:glycosyltransferase involved in cell wall biosynthesis